ncbi:MAG: hypothetical protein ABJZ74_13270, partial [Nitratireductor sp.]
ERLDKRALVFKIGRQRLAQKPVRREGYRLLSTQNIPDNIRCQKRERYDPLDSVDGLVFALCDFRKTLAEPPRVCRRLFGLSYAATAG